MINDSLKNSEKYAVLGEDFKRVFDFLSTLTDKTETGRYDVSDRAFVNVSEGMTRKRSDARYEVHDKYADVQYMISGRENIDICGEEKLTVTEDMTSENDIRFLSGDPGFSTVYLESGDFAVIFPGEAHRPLTAVDDVPVSVLKAVAKIKID